MSTKDMMQSTFADSKQSGQGSYTTKTPFLIEDILCQASKSQGSQKVNCESNSGTNINSEKLSKNSDMIAAVHGNDEDYRKIFQSERYF